MQRVLVQWLLYFYCHIQWLGTETVFVCEVGRNSVMKAKVKPSQRLTSEPHQAWVAIVKSTGTVITGHCTCMAGLVYIQSQVHVIVLQL